MKILDTSNFVSERAKVKPITNSEWGSVKKELEKNQAKSIWTKERRLDRQDRKLSNGCCHQDDGRNEKARFIKR